MVATASGFEQRNVRWTQARGKWDVASGIKKRAQMDTLIAFFRARKGRAYGFRFKDWTDYKAPRQSIGTGDGVTMTFQLVKAYSSGGVTETRRIYTLDFFGGPVWSFELDGDGQFVTPVKLVARLDDHGSTCDALMGCIGSGGELWAVGGTSTASALWRIGSDGDVQLFDLSSSVLDADRITYDPGTGCLFIAGSGGVLLKWSIAAAAPVGEPLTAVVGPYSTSAFRRGVKEHSFWCSYGNTVREIDTVTLAITRSIRLIDWGITSMNTAVSLEPLCNALWGLGSFHGSGAIKVLLDRVAATGTTVDLVVAEIAGKTGLGLSDLDVSALADESVRGYIIGRRSTARSCIEQLMQAFQFDAVESGGILKFVKRGSVPCLTLGEDDLAAGTPGEDKGPPLSITRTQDVELPVLVNVLYINPDADYQQGHQQARRLAVATTDQSITVELPMVITDTQAIQLAERVLYTAWTERSRFELRLMRRFVRIEPTDVIDVVENGSANRLRITGATLGPDGVYKLKAVAEDEEVYVSTRQGAATDFEPAVIVFQGPTTLTLIDGPMLFDDDDNAGFYCAVHGQTDAWRGATIYASSDDVTWSDITSFFGEATAGATTTVLPDCPRWGSWDRTGTVEVRMLRGDLASAATELDVLNGGNVLMIGNEIVQFATAEEIDADLYRLSNLLRGRRGTEGACGTHAEGDRVVKLDSVALQRIHMASAGWVRRRRFRRQRITAGISLRLLLTRMVSGKAGCAQRSSPVRRTQATEPPLSSHNLRILRGLVL